MSEQARYGASPGAWEHWDLVLGLGEDLLPVVADKHGFTLKTVELGVDEDVDAISSCVVEHGAVITGKGKVKKMGVLEETIIVRRTGGAGSEARSTEPLPDPLPY